MVHTFRSIGPIRLAQQLIKIADQALTQQCSLTYAQFKVLLFLSEHDQSDQQNLAACLELTEAAISRLTETLAAKGFLTRQPNPDNRRQNMLALTTTGHQKLQTAISLVQKLEHELYSKLPTPLLNSFEQATSQLLDIMQNQPAPTRA